MLYNVYDSVSTEWFKRGDWTKPGKMTKLWRQRGPLKLSLISAMDNIAGRYNITLPLGSTIRLEIAREYPDMYWQDAIAEMHRRRIQLLPDFLHVYEYTKEGPIFVATLKEWY